MSIICTNKKGTIEKNDYYVTIKYGHWSLYITMLDVSTKCSGYIPQQNKFYVQLTSYPMVKSRNHFIYQEKDSFSSFTQYNIESPNHGNQKRKASILERKK